MSKSKYAYRKDAAFAQFNEHLDAPMLDLPKSDGAYGEPLSNLFYAEFNVPEDALFALWKAARATVQSNAASVAAIQFALEAEEGMKWLQLWNEGSFESCRREWPEAPDECYIGADQFFVAKGKQS